MRNSDPHDFYEEDEPLEKIKTIFENGEKVRTRRPSHGVTETLRVPGLLPGPVMGQSPNQPLGHLVSSGH